MFQSGQQIGSYTLLHRLGKGGFGEVWLAEKRSQLVTKKVAVKLPHEDQINIEAIRQEAALWEQASGHANVLPIIDADVINGQVLIVSEYADGGSLQDKLKREGKLPIKKAVEMTIGILSGLEFLHHKRIIHRDIKPQNILLQGETPRLADFGISRAMQTTIISSTIIGTDAYMSPESFDGKRSVQTDIWSVGVVLYQLLAASLPFPQEHASERMFAIFSKEFAPLGNEIPADLRRIVSRALAKQPENRYQTTTEMRDDLQKALLHIAHPTFAPTEPFRIPLEHLPPISTIVNNPQTDRIEKETVINNLQIPVITPTAIQNESIQTQFNPVHLTENKNLPTEVQTFADRTPDRKLMPLSYRLGLAAFLGVTGLVIVIAIFTFLSTTQNISPPKNSSNVSNVNLSSTALMNIELKTLADLTPLKITVDGKDATDSRTSPHISSFTAQSSFTFEYSVYAVDKFQLKINGKVITLSKTPPLGDYMSKLVVTKDNLNQILQNGSNEKVVSNANVVSSANTNSSVSNSAATTEMNVEFTATEPVAFFIRIDGGKEDAVILAPTVVKKITPQKNFEMSYSPEKSSVIRLKINGKSISIPNYASSKKEMVKFIVTKDDLTEILASGKVTKIL